MQELNGKAAIITTPWDAIKGEQILKVMEGQDSLEMKLLAEAHHKAEEEEHEHHHDHDHEEHEHDHDHEEHEHHHHHDHDHEEHEHHHDHDHEEHEHHHEHDENCTCGCHDHDHEHHHHHHADEVFTSWGKETPHKFTREKIEEMESRITPEDSVSLVLRLTNTRLKNYSALHNARQIGKGKPCRRFQYIYLPDLWTVVRPH